VNKKEKQRWLCAIDRCLKQDEYFTDADKCELCLEANGNCDECICFEYSKHLGLLFILLQYSKVRISQQR